MPTNRIIPSLLLRDGRLVKGEVFAAHRDAGNPATTARAHNAQGADEIVALDIDASKQGRGPDLDAVTRIAAEAQIPLTIGGGITSPDIARDCLAAGADKVCLTTAALDAPELLTAVAQLCGRQAVVLGVDVMTNEDGTQHIFDHRTRTTLPDLNWCEWMKKGVELGAGEIRLMSVAREGCRTGFDLELHAKARAVVNTPIILEGGAGTLEDLTTAMSAGADSLAVGTMLVFSDNNIVKLKSVLAGAGQPMRP